MPAAFARALLLAERDRHLDAPGDVAGRARLARWRAQPPFGQDRWWQARLAADELPEPVLLALLGESGAGLAARHRDPAWAAAFAEVMLVAGYAGDPGGDWGEAVFAPVAGDLLIQARACLRDRLRGLAAQRPDRRAFDPDRLTEQLFAPLPLALHRILVRSLVLELHQARGRGDLAGGDAAQRFASFVRALRADAGRRRALFTAYPVLARQLQVEADAWLRASEMLAAHLAADIDMIGPELAGGRRLGDLAQVVTGLGDRHRGGAAVARVRWADGTEVIYKPRPMAVDAHFQQLVSWLNDRGLDPPLRTVWCLDRGDHGWMECVTPAACTGDGGYRRFYQRQGSLLALLYLLGATDFHAENLIAAGEHPVLVDLETVAQPGLPVPEAGLSAADVTAAEAARASVMTAGLLPARSWTRLTGEAVDVSGLGFVTGQRSPLAVATVKDPGLDTMRIEIARGDVQLGNRQHGDGDPRQLLDYLTDILTGFTRAYQICAADRSEMAAGPLAAFAPDVVRVLIRPTLWYATVLSIGFHPDLLRDALDRERHFDVLWHDVPGHPQLAACIPHERADLWANDIPYFTAAVSGSVLYGSSGRPVQSFPLVPAMDRIRARLAGLSPADLARQRWLISAAVGTSAAGHLDAPPRAPRHGPAAAAARPATTARDAPDQLLAAAAAIGNRLAAIGFVTDDSAQWLGVNSRRGAAWSFGPLGPDLFHGLTGMALFLGWLGHLAADDAYTVLARKALNTACCQLGRKWPPGFGGMAGVGGLTYGLTELGKLWSDESLIDTAEDHALLAGRHAADDVLYDFTGGAAGTIAGLAALHTLRPTSALESAIRACADHLLATAIHTETGIGWLSDQIRYAYGARLPLAGYAHGNAGIIAPLFQAAEILGEDRYRDAALQALRYEQSLFRPATGTWSDLRDPRMSQHALPRPHWCFGAAGIGLSRLSTLARSSQDHATRDEINAALHAVTSQPTTSHCLCHGDFGSIDLLLQAAQLLSQPHLHDQASRQALSALKAASRGQWTCGLPLGIQTPGLMYGLAGIGYGILRVINTDHVPAVLTLTPASCPPP